MTDEQRDEKISDLQQHAMVTDAKFEMFMNEMRESRERHEAEMREIKEDIRATNNRMDAMFTAMDTKMDNITKHVQSLVTATTAGIGAVVVGIAAIVVALFIK